MKQVSAERCREQAMIHRRMAEEADAPEVREKLLRIAESYEELTRHVLKSNAGKFRSG
jgi:hypothetical protein